MNVRRTRITVAVVAMLSYVFMLSGCWGWLPHETFDIYVTPKSIVDFASGQTCTLLVSIAELGDYISASPVALSVTSSAGKVSVSPETIEGTDVAEITLDSTDAAVGSNMIVTVEGRRKGEIHTASATAMVTGPVHDPDDRLLTGTAVRDEFLSWMETAHPELGISTDTVWIPQPLRPHIMEVLYYMFQSEKWELVVWWHVMIPPYDWARVYLRRRHSEISPSFAAEISSFSSSDEPHAIDPPSEIWR